MLSTRIAVQGKYPFLKKVSKNQRMLLYILVAGMTIVGASLLGTKVLLSLLICLGVFLFVEKLKNTHYTPISAGIRSGKHYVENTSMSNVQNASVQPGNSFSIASCFTCMLLLAGLCISLGLEIVYVRDFLDGGSYERMNTVFKFSIQAWLCLSIGGALAVQQLWGFSQGMLKRIWGIIFVLLVLGGSIFLVEGTAARIGDHQNWIVAQPPVQDAHYTPSLDGFAFIQAWYPGDADAIEWLNDHVAGSPVILEAASPISFQWFNRVSIYTGLPDVLGWADHVEEQHYSDQSLNRVVDIGIIYTTPDEVQAITLLRYYHVRYIYVGDLERQAYAQQSTTGLDKFNHMVGKTLRIVYHKRGVTIYEVL